MKTNFILHYYGGMDLQVRLEEDWNEIDLFIVYEDHGDEFLRIRTKDGENYEYGYIGNRKHITNEKQYYITQPELFYAEDEHSTLANKIYHQVKWTSKRNGIDGYCGKFIDYLIDENSIICENVKLIIHKNKIKHNCTKREINFDEWGIATYEINLKQFN